MKSITILAIVFSAAACQQKKPQSAGQTKAPDLSGKMHNINRTILPRAVELIVPGVRIGNIAINGNTDSVVNMMGKPDVQDAAMGSSLMTWYANHDTSGNKTSIFSQRRFGSKTEDISHVHRILVTAPAYTTAEGLHTGLYLGDIKKQYSVKPSGGYTAKGSKVITYDAAEKGIAFEIDSLSSKCVAILVHQPGDAGATYIDMHQ